MTSALTREQVISDYIPKLKSTAAKIGHELRNATLSSAINREAS